jgi:tRNA pseudouridine55 synthase
MRFGFATDTYDREGIPITEEHPLEGGEDDVREGIRSLTGILEQIPPPFSAKKVGGVPSHKLARRNEAVELAPSRVEIERFEMLRLMPPLMTFRVVCSPGTYIRSLAHDLGRRLGCGAHLTALRRTRSGEFRIQDSVPLDRAAESDLIPMDRLLPSMPRIEVSGPDEVRVRHGNPVNAGSGLEPFARIFNKQGEFIAVASVENGLAHPRLVLTSVTSDESDKQGCILEKRD